MDKKRSFLPALVLTALVSFLAAVLVLLGAAWAVLGTEGAYAVNRNLCR